MGKENDQIESKQNSDNIPAHNHKTALTKKGLLLRILVWIVLILIIDLSLTTALIILEKRFSGSVHKFLSLPAILTLILSLKIAIIMLSGKVIMFLFRRFR